MQLESKQLVNIIAILNILGKKASKSKHRSKGNQFNLFQK